MVGPVQDGMAGMDWERKGVARQDTAGMVLQVLASFDSAGRSIRGTVGHGRRGEDRCGRVGHGDGKAPQVRIGRQVMYR